MGALKLSHKAEFEIIPTRPFHFDSTFFKPGHFPSKDMKWRSGKRCQTMLWPSFAKASAGKRWERLGTIFENAGTAKNPKIKVTIYSRKKLSPEFIGSVKDEVIWRYNLDLDLSGFYRDVGSDKFLKPIIKRFHGLRPMHHGSLYEYLIIAIVLQNATVRRSVYMMQTLFENYGTRLDFAGEQLWCFWEPRKLAQAPELKLRALKMGYRAKSLIKTSIAFAQGQIDEMELRRASSVEQAEALISLYGIGPASVGYIMFDVFHRWDFLKHISPWEQKIYNRIFFNQDWERKLVAADKMLRYFDRWGKWKNLAVHYVWENIWWRRRHEKIPWLEKLIRL